MTNPISASVVLGIMKVTKALRKIVEEDLMINDPTSPVSDEVMQKCKDAIKTGVEKMTQQGENDIEVMMELLKTAINTK